MRDGKFLFPLGIVLIAAACGGSETPSQPSGSAGAAGKTGGAAGATMAAAGATAVAGAGAPAAGAPTVPSAGASSGGASAGGSAGASTGGSSTAGGTAGAATPGGPVSVQPPMNPTPVGNQSLPRKLYIENRCPYAIWNFALPQSTFPNNVPYKMEANTAVVVGWPDDWSGRTWARTDCTGDGNNLKCAQKGDDTLVEFTLTRGMNSDWYDISLVDGFTIPAGILQLDVPWASRTDYVVGGVLGTNEICGSPICAVDMNPSCPATQQQKDANGKVVGCKSGPKNSDAAKYLKAGCPTSYSYDFDDPQSLFRCPTAVQNGGKGAKDYDVIYCPTQGPIAGFP